MTIAHPNCTPPGLCLPSTGRAKLPVPRIPTPIVYVTFDIGLGEQHKLNCLRQRGTCKASWDGLGKYTEFYLTLVRSAPIQVNVIVLLMKGILYCFVGHFRLMYNNTACTPCPLKYPYKSLALNRVYSFSLLVFALFTAMLSIDASQCCSHLLESCHHQKRKALFELKSIPIVLLCFGSQHLDLVIHTALVR